MTTTRGMSAFARAITPHGVQASRTAVTLTDTGPTEITMSFTCLPTPITFTMDAITADALARECLQYANTVHRRRLTKQFDHAPTETSTMTITTTAQTPFGPITGRARLHTDTGGEDLVILTTHAGQTPITLTMAGANYFNFIRALITHTNALRTEDNRNEWADFAAIQAS